MRRVSVPMEIAEKPGGRVWKRFVRRHWKMTLAAVGGIVAIAAVALLVFLWVVADMQATGRVPSGVGAWTVGYAITFLLNLILWELLLVASWVVVLVAAAYLIWYRRLPPEERAEYETGSRRGKSAGANGGISFFTGLVWLVIVWTDGRWNLPLQDWTVNQFVYSWIAAGLVVLLIVGIPAMVYLFWSLARTD